MEVQDLGGAQGSLIGLHLLNLQTEQIQGFPFILKQLWLLFSKAQASNSVLCPPPPLSPFPVAFTLVFLAVSPSFLSLKAKTASQCMPVKHVGLRLKVVWVLRSPAPPPLFTLPPSMPTDSNTPHPLTPTPAQSEVDQVGLGSGALITTRKLKKGSNCFETLDKSGSHLAGL